MHDETTKSDVVAVAVGAAPVVEHDFEFTFFGYEYKDYRVGDPLTVGGIVVCYQTKKPPPVNTQVTMKVTKPDGTVLSFSTWTDATGTFRLSLLGREVDQAGTWQFQAEIWTTSYNCGAGVVSHRGCEEILTF